MTVPSREDTFQYSVGRVEQTSTHPEVERINAKISVTMFLMLFSTPVETRLVRSSQLTQGLAVHRKVHWPENSWGTLHRSEMGIPELMVNVFWAVSYS